MTNREFIEGLPEREAIYVLYSEFTRCPYIVCNSETFDDETIVCTKEEDAVELVKQFRKDNVLTKLFRISKEGIIPFLAELFIYGVNAVRFKTEDGELLIQLEDMIKRQLPEGISEMQKPVENPLLQLGMIYFMQEFGHNNKNIEKLKALEEEMIVNMVRATFLLPGMSEVVEGNKVLRPLMMKHAEEDRQAIPIFTDGHCLSKFMGNRQMEILKLSAEQLASMQMPENTVGFVINPGVNNVELSMEKLVKIAKEYK